MMFLSFSSNNNRQTQTSLFISMKLLITNSTLLLLTLLLLYSSSYIKVVSANNSNSNNGIIKCQSGFGDDNEYDVTVPIEKINDGYCDCPISGIDEPLTEACSGSMNWPGIIHGNKQPSEQTSELPVYFQCPQQKNIKLPLSRINDGICDCCDGADEIINPKKCTDRCNEMLAEERKQKELITNKYTVGSKILQDNINKFNDRVKENNNSIESINTIDIPATNDKLDVIKKRMNKKHIEYSTNRIKQLKSIVSDDSESSDDSVSLKIHDIINPLTKTELITLIVYTCQLSGEMENHNNNNEKRTISKTCTSLRLAGLDMGILWDDNENDTGTSTTSTGDDDDKTAIIKVQRCIRESNDNNDIEIITNNDNDNDQHTCNFNDIIDLMLKHSRKEYISSWSPSSSTGKEATNDSNANNNRDKDNKKRNRYHDHHDHDDDYYDEDDEDMYDDHHHHDDDDMMYADYDEDDNDNNNNDTNESSSSSLRTKLKQMSLSKIRNENFLLHGKKIISTIDKILDEMNSNNSKSNDNDDDIDTNKDDEKENEKEQNDNDENSNDEQQVEEETIDPATYRMVRNTIKKRHDNINNGYTYGESALNLINSLFLQKEGILSGIIDGDNDKNLFLKRLAIGTLYYSNINSKDLYQILMFILHNEQDQDEGSCSSNDDDDDNNKSCADMTTTTTITSILCPPQSIERNGIQYPPKSIINAGEDLCNELLNTKEESIIDCSATTTSSSSSDNDDDTSSSNIDIPTNMVNGYCGYTTIQARRKQEEEDTDQLSIMFKPLEDIMPSSELDDLQKKQNELNKKIKDMERNVKTLNDEIDINKYGPDGILYSMKDDTCHSITAGKYVYEVCIFGSAKQKDGGSSTSLGNWDGISRSNGDDHMDNTLTMKWSNGQKCWNGPKRSATVYVTCGKEHKLLSAEEPDTCRYVIEMESPLGCDEAYKNYYDL